MAEANGGTKHRQSGKNQSKYEHGYTAVRD